MKSVGDSLTFSDASLLATVFSTLTLAAVTAFQRRPPTTATKEAALRTNPLSQVASSLCYSPSFQLSQ